MKPSKVMRFLKRQMTTIAAKSMLMNLLLDLAILARIQREHMRKKSKIRGKKPRIALNF